MLTWIPVLIATIYLWVRFHQLKSLTKHIAKQYPDEWQKLQHNPTKLSSKAALMANLEASMLNGFLAQTNDPKITGFFTLQKRLSLVFTVLILISLVQLFVASSQV